MSKYLIGKTISKIKIAKDKKAVLFVVDGEDVIAQADGDCCSSTWIEHIELPSMGFPAMVLDVDDVEMPDLGTPNDSECIAYYGCKISTDKGDMLIDYRNESIGYYGGSLIWPDEYFYGGVYGQNESDEIWVDVDKDI